MKKNSLLLAASAAFSITFGSAPALAQKLLPGDKPKLIVQVVIGQLRSDYLLRFKANLSDEGFKMLTTEGAFCQNARYTHLLTQTAPGLATIATGAAPAHHGVPSDRWYDRSQNDMQEACYDPRVATVESGNDKLKKSPKHLLASTFGDELKLLKKRSKVVGISMLPEEAILLSGHNSNAAYWYDEMSGKFVSSSYYMEELPQWVQEFNQKKFTDAYAIRSWEATLPATKYAANKKKKEAAAKNDEKNDEKNSEAAEAPANLLLKAAVPPKNSRSAYATLHETPYSDNLVKDFAISAIVSENMGHNGATDMIAIYFGAMRSIANRYGALSVELEDAFYRTDQNLKHLISFLTSHVGKENLLLVLTSDHGVNLSQPQLQEANMPHGVFDHNKALVLLRSYLNIAYGKGDWIKSFSQKQIFLNHTLIEDSNLRLSEVQERAASFVLQFSGVANAATAHVLSGATFADGVMRYMQNSFFPKRSGDIIVNLEPGWTETSSTSAANSAYSYDTHVPLVFYGWRVKRKSITAQVDMTDIAPTLSTLVGVPLPNAASGKVIAEIVE
ncbi:MAG: alkaline phosphatase family protein [Prevotellaceae bacterium]|jgi:predicted AlkP superfamily pyrophosphatase or phosphodiesterase|nr:alkaline phosphatase family protein [Prevotellaceae bacterium]